MKDFVWLQEGFKMVFNLNIVKACWKRINI